MSEINNILVTGAAGQIGSELVPALRGRFGGKHVLATDMRIDPPEVLSAGGPFEILDVSNRKVLDFLCDKYQINAIVHLAAILSATGEKNPQKCWDVNINGSINVLESALARKMVRVLIPSSIAAFGPETPRDNTPQETVLKPKTMYGVTKVAGELLSDYYFHKFGLDVRGLRYPGIISSETLPGGGTTDYAVEIYYKAIEQGSYTCFLREDTRLPMMYMPDCLKATMDLFMAPLENLVHHSDFNVGAMSFSAGELAACIAKEIPGFTVTYEPDFRQSIADSWPMSIDDSAARKEWGWMPQYNLESMTRDMLNHLRKRHAEGILYG